MDKNTWIGFGLMAAIIVGFTLMNRPSQEELAERQRINDSIAMVQLMEQETQKVAAQLEAQKSADVLSEEENAQQLEIKKQQLYGHFAVAATGENRQTVLENERLRLTIDALGGRIARAELKEYRAYGDTVNPVCLFRGDEAEMSFTLVTDNNRILPTRNLYFTPVEQTDTTVVMRLLTDDEDAWLDFCYTLPKDEYMVRFAIRSQGMNRVLAQNVQELTMQWRQLVPQQEKGRKFEDRYARLQYMTVGHDQEQLSESKHDSKKESARIKWLAYKDLFFSSILIADDAFTSTVMESTPQDQYTRYMKEYQTEASVRFDPTGQKETGFRFYLGPNHYNTLKAYDEGLAKEDRLELKRVVYLGYKIVSWVNVILVIPMFDLLTGWGLRIGLIILIMTLVIKLIILPFIYKSYQSSAKMRVLKPQMDAINEKYPPEKMQERQQATMALYQRAGVSPMSGCLPMLFQFPVVMAMFFFFPTAIELRGQSFLWADDLSTYDAIISWGTNIPFIGDHLSLFCILFTLVNVLYTYTTMQSQPGGNDPSAKMMKWMMYLMPLMFFFIFNDYPAGLSYYYLLSMFFSIAQTYIFRWAIDDKKLLAQMEANAKKREKQPKSGFMARLEEMQREQQRMARENAKAAQRRR